MRRLITCIMAAAVLLLAVLPLFSQESSKALYEQGMEAFKAKNYGSAGLIFRKIVDADDEYRDRAWYQLGLSVFRQRKYEAAIFEFNRFLLECTTSNLCAQSRFWIAEADYHQKKYIKAIEGYNRFIAQSSDDEMTQDAQKRIGEIYYIQNRYDEAVLVWSKTLEHITEADKKNKLSLKIGEALFLNEQYDQALGVLEPLRSVRGEGNYASRAALIIGRVYQLKSNPRKALRYFNSIPEPMLKEKPYYDAQYFKSLSYLDLGQQYAAKSNLELFLIIGQDSDWYNDAKYDLGKLYIGENNETKGVKFLEDARNGTTKMELRSKAAMELAKIYLKKNPRDAIPYLEDSVSLNDPEEQKNALLLLSRVYIEADRNEDAERLLDLMVNKYPYDSSMEEVQFLLSRVYLSRGQDDKAEQGFKKIREINPFSRYIGESSYYLALAAHNEKDNAKSVEYLTRYLAQKNPEQQFQATIKLHSIYLETGDFDNADKVMTGVMRRYRGRPGVDDIVYETGLLYREKGRRYDKLFDFVLEDSPRSATAGKALIVLGDDSFQKKQYAAAERYYRQYLAVPGRDNASSVFLYREISLYRLERFRDVLRLVEEEKIPQSDEFTVRLVRLWEGKSEYQLGRLKQAYEILKGYDLSNFSDDDLSMMVKISLQSKDIDTARRAASRLMRNRDLYAGALFDLGAYFKQAGDREQAGRYYSDLISKCPESDRLPAARLELADILIEKKAYGESIAELEKVSGEQLETRRSALLIEACFASGNDGRALDLTEKNASRLQKSPYGEKVFRKNLLYYYGLGDQANFKKIADMLSRYPGNGNFIVYYGGRLEFETGAYANSYYSFYKLSANNNEYRPEALYHLGLLSLYEQKNHVRAITYFSRLAKDAEPGNLFGQKAKLILALDLHDRGDDMICRDQLYELMSSARDRMVLDQSLNLYESFGYYGRKSADGATQGK